MLLNVLWGMRRMRWLALVPAIAAAEVYADTIRVPDDYDTIQRAVNNSLHNDEIIVADGVWTGAGFHEIHTRGKRITVRSEGGPDNCILDCQGEGRGFHIYEDEDENTRIEGFTVRNGQAVYGGGMRVGDATPIVVNCVFENNNADFGGGLSWESAYPTAGGGAADNRSVPDLTGCSFIGNAAAFDGGGVYLDGPDLPDALVGCVLRNNTALGAGRGGGVYGYVDLIDCIVDANTAGYGGGIYAGGGYCVNTVFTGNQAVYGGAMYRYGSSRIYVKNCTYNGNIAAELGGAMCLRYGNPNWTSYLHNTILWDNSPDHIYTFAYNELEVEYCCIQGGYVGQGNIDTDPLFVGDEDSHLQPGSPCIDAGNNNDVPDEVLLDLDGNPRFVNDPDTPDTGIGYPCVDIGAYEFQPSNDCPEDVNRDEVVDIDDLFQVLGEWGSCDDCAEDVNDDGLVDIDDVFQVLGTWGPCE